MNTLEIAKMLDKRHDNVKRDVISSPHAEGLLSMSICNKETGKEVEVYDIPVEQIAHLKYGELLLDKIDNERLRKKVKELEKENKEYKNQIADKDKTKKLENIKIVLPIWKMHYWLRPKKWKT